LPADQNYGDRLVALGRYLREGIGVSADAKGAVVLFRRAVDQNLPDGQYWFGCCMRSETGCPHDYATVVRWKRKPAANADHGFSANLFSKMLERGDGTAKGIAEAVRYCQLSSDLGCPKGMFNFADMHHHGKHVPKDAIEVMRLYKLAADPHIPEAFFALCEIYRDGESPMPASPELALDAAKLSADRSHFRRLVHYAELLEAGIGVARDHAQAEALFTTASTPALCTHRHNYAFELENGKGCREQPEKALKYYRISDAPVR
jgi:TPR repeat protein